MMDYDKLLEDAEGELQCWGLLQLNRTKQLIQAVRDLKKIVELEQQNAKLRAKLGLLEQCLTGTIKDQVAKLEAFHKERAQLLEAQEIRAKRILQLAKQVQLLEATLQAKEKALDVIEGHYDELEAKLERYERERK
jgi:hypothetical protein